MINYTTTKIENEQMKLVLKLMVQLKNPIVNLEKPYEFKSQIRVPNCLLQDLMKRKRTFSLLIQSFNYMLLKMILS